MNDLEILAHGFAALENLLQHSHDPCWDCRRASWAEQLGSSEAAVAQMLCEPMRQWPVQITAARELAGRVLA